MIPIIGLGNPGKEYEYTRHNVGFRVLDVLAGSESWSYDKYLLSDKCIVTVNNEQLLLLKPRTFMNESGKVLEGIQRIDPFMLSKLIVVHDEIDLSLGSVKISHDRGHGGHNGIKSINHHFGSKEYSRVRVGISKTGENGELYKPNVLGVFGGDEESVLKDILLKSAEAVEKIVSLGYSIAANEINQK